MDWQPIESAPKDETEILVAHCDAVGFMQVVGWDEAKRMWTAPEGCSYMYDAFSHWMPLPPPPAAEGGRRR